MRNFVAKNAWKFNRAQTVKPKKGPGSYVRAKKEKCIDRD